MIHDVALQNLPVIFCIDRAGLVGEDGATHQGSFDLAFLRSVPNLIISSPLNEHELRNMMFTAYKNAKEGGIPFVIRYPRGRGVLTDWHNNPQILPIGKADLLRQGEKVLVLSLGPLGNNVSAAIDALKEENINPAHLNVRFLKPLDEEKLQELAAQYPIWLTVEAKTAQKKAASSQLWQNFWKNISSPINCTTWLFRIGSSRRAISRASITRWVSVWKISNRKSERYIKQLYVSGWTLL